MSARGAEGIIAARKAQGLTATGQPVDKGTAGHTSRRSAARKGAVKGAAEGAVAGPEGAAAGAAGGAISGATKKKSSPKKSGGGFSFKVGSGRSHGNRALVAEFAVCMAILTLSPLVDKGGSLTVNKFMKKASATAGLFIVLGFIAATGDTGRKAATGLGGLVTLTVLLNERSVFGVMVKALNGSPVDATPGPQYTPEQLQASVGGFTPQQYVNNIITGDPNINPDMTPGAILTPFGIPGEPTQLPGPPVGIPGLPPGIGGNG